MPVIIAVATSIAIIIIIIIIINMLWGMEKLAIGKMPQAQVAIVTVTLTTTTTTTITESITAHPVSIAMPTRSMYPSSKATISSLNSDCIVRVDI